MILSPSYDAVSGSVGECSRKSLRESGEAYDSKSPKALKSFWLLFSISISSYALDEDPNDCFLLV